jgi:hypothetical protein
MSLAKSNEDYVTRIAYLLGRDATLRRWFEITSAWITDELGRYVLKGLSADETTEFLELNVIVRSGRETLRDLDRYLRLRRQHQTTAGRE